MGTKSVTIEKIKPYPKNTKKHPKNQIEQIANSIKEFGFNQPIVIDKDNVIIVGHGRYEAAKLLQLKEVPVIQVEINPEQAKAYRLADNKLNESDWDMDLVIEELKGLSEEMFDLTGFDKDLLIEPDEKDDVVPENVPTRAKLGDIWQLGQHRVMCGDSTKKEDVEKLMDGKKADMVFTDPPYGNLQITNKKGEVGNANVAGLKKYHKYSGEGDFDFRPCWEIIKELSNKIIIWGGNYFADFLPITTGWIVWDKRADEHSWYSDCELAWTSLGIPAKVYKQVWQGMIREGEKVKREHPTQKPVEMLSNIITDFSKREMLIVDLFLGSGSTLIACEKTNRICYGMEIDEHYCDVIIKRFEDYTGQKAEKICPSK